MYFRADKRQFEVGDMIKSAGEFGFLNPLGSGDVEEIFERVRPGGKPSRIGSLFLFKDERAAKKHWSKMTGGNLYLAIPIVSSSNHEGDMRLINEAFNQRADATSVEQIASRYWSGELTEEPIVEILAASATISAIISKDQQERQAYFKSWALA